MSNYTINLDKEIYQTLLEVSQSQGLTPENWIAAQLSHQQAEAEPLPEKIGDLIGAIDSQAEPHHQFNPTEFGEQVATKLSQQGIHRP